jgi:hypothetical protein
VGQGGSKSPEGGKKTWEGTAFVKKNNYERQINRFRKNNQCSSESNKTLREIITGKII